MRKTEPLCITLNDASALSPEELKLVQEGLEDIESGRTVSLDEVMCSLDEIKRKLLEQQERTA